MESEGADLGVTALGFSLPTGLQDVRALPGFEKLSDHLSPMGIYFLKIKGKSLSFPPHQISNCSRVFSFFSFPFPFCVFPPEEDVKWIDLSDDVMVHEKPLFPECKTSSHGERLLLRPDTISSPDMCISIIYMYIFLFCFQCRALQMQEGQAHSGDVSDQKLLLR